MPPAPTPRDARPETARAGRGTAAGVSPRPPTPEALAHL
jgi:hypothetical protein